MCRSIPTNRGRKSTLVILFFCVSLLPRCATAQTSDAQADQSKVASPAPNDAEDESTARLRRYCRAAPADSYAEWLVQQAVSNLPELDQEWLQEDAVYIISPEERCAFLLLAQPEEREQFISQFWLRRNPNPDVPGNDYEEEHYRRIIFSNDHFATDIPGWKTERGRAYIVYGPPDQVESHSAINEPLRNVDLFTRNGINQPGDWWKYNYLEGIGANVVLDFTKESSSPALQLLAAVGQEEEFTRDRNQETSPPETEPIFNRLQLFVGPVTVEPRFKDLQALLVAGLKRTDMDAEPKVALTRATRRTIIASFTVNVPESQLHVNSDGWAYTVFGRVTNDRGRIEFTFEHECSSSVENDSACRGERSMADSALQPGSYRLGLVVKDEVGGQVGTAYLPIKVPESD
jgi:GWxTD domain-containing protein